MCRTSVCPAGQERFECLTYKPARSQPDYMKVICIGGKLEPQQRRPAAKKKANSVFKTYFSNSSASIILECRCKSLCFVKNHWRQLEGVLIYISSPLVMDFPHRPHLRQNNHSFVLPPVPAATTISLVFQKHKI